MNTTPDPLAAPWADAQMRYRAGDLPGAARACERVLALDPLHSPARLLASGLASAAGRHRLATEHALAATRRIGRQPLQHVIALGATLITVGEYEAAATLLRRIDPVAVPAPGAIAEISQQLSLLEQHDDALRYLEAALRNGLSGDWANYVHGNYLRFLGRMEDAAAAYEASLARNPHYALAQQALATLAPPGDPAPRIARIRASLARTAVPPRDVAYLEYALFKELDATGDTDGAWRALAAGARARRAEIVHDREAEGALFRAIADATPHGFVPPGGAPADGPVPLFVLGLPRTGTTLLERILGGHPGVVLCGELNDFRMQYKWASDHACLGFFDAEAVRRLGGTDHAELGRRYLQHVAWRTGDAHAFTDKNPGNFMMVGPILRALPAARILHLRRNPMDSCFSNLKELFGGNAHAYSYDFDDLAAHYAHYRGLMDHWHAIAPGRILDVDYESLVSEPEAQARRVMAYCGLDYRDDQVRVEAMAAPVSTASSAQVRQPIHARNVGGWRRYATPLEPLRQRLAAQGFDAPA